MQLYFGTALTLVAGALAVAGVAQTAAQALAQPPTSSRCQLSSTERCVLKSFNVVPNPNDPAVYVLQLDTTGGPHAFAADRPTLERLGRELLDVVEGRGTRRL